MERSLLHLRFAKLSGELNAAYQLAQEMLDKKDVAGLERATTAVKIYTKLVEELESKLKEKDQGSLHQYKSRDGASTS